MEYPDVVIVSGARTPIGRFQGALSAIPAPELGGIAIKAAVERAGIDGALVDEVLMGNVVPVSYTHLDVYKRQSHA